jgi:RHS repeat-associated protein
MAANIAQGTIVLGQIYGPEHERINGNVPGIGVVWYLTDPSSGAQAEEFDPTGSGPFAWRDYIMADGKLVAIRTCATTSATAPCPGTTPSYVYTVADHLGSTAALSDASGTVVERDAYDPWGKRRNPNGTDDAACALVSATVKGYTGHDTVDAQCLIDAKARFYDPAIARFISADTYVADPLDGQDWNAYSYVDNRPLALTDPTGHADVGNDQSDVHVTVRIGEDIDGNWHAMGLVDKNGNLIAGTASRATAIYNAGMLGLGGISFAGASGARDTNGVSQSIAYFPNTSVSNSHAEVGPYGTLAAKGVLNGKSMFVEAEPHDKFTIELDTIAIGGENPPSPKWEGRNAKGLGGGTEEGGAIGPSLTTFFHVYIVDDLAGPLRPNVLIAQGSMVNLMTVGPFQQIYGRATLSIGVNDFEETPGSLPTFIRIWRSRPGDHS